jgi:hypothetical protein
MMWSADEISLRNNCPESVMDTYRLAVFSEHPIDTPTLTAQELRDTQTALMEFLRQTQPDKPDGRLYEGVDGWEELLEAVREDAA